MIDYEYKDLFLQDSIEKQVTISYGNTTITNEDLFNQTMTLDESLCSENSLVFGSCEASVLKFKVANIVASMKGQWIDVKMVLEENTSNPFMFGHYKVNSDKLTADRQWREVVAYDALYDVINTNVIEWYNSVLPDSSSSMTIKQFRTSFLGYFGIKEADISLINDGEVIGRTWKKEELSGAVVIRAICEINGCFGHIGRDGLFHYIYLAQGIQGLYPSNDIYPADDLYPRDPKTTPISKNFYIGNPTYEDFTTDSIEKLQIINGDTGVISTVGNGDNCYTIESNFLVAGKTKEELDGIGKKILEKIRGITYRPFDAECIGNPCFEVGDPIRLSTTYDIVETYILKRTLKGIQALRDSYSSDGVKKYETKVNSIDRAVSQLNDRTETLKEDVGIINEDIVTINEDIEIIDEDIVTINEDIDTINENVGELNISLEKTESGLQAEVSRATAAEGNLSSRITITESEITAEVSRAKGEEENLSSRIKLTADEITSEVTRAKGEEESLSSRIKQTISDISLTVNNGDTTAGIVISLKSEDGNTETLNGTINMTGLVNFTDLSGYGTTTINGANIKTGTITADQIKVGTITADLLSVDALDGQTLRGVNIYAQDFTCYGSLKMGESWHGIQMPSGYEAIRFENRVTALGSQENVLNFVLPLYTTATSFFHDYAYFYKDTAFNCKTTFRSEATFEDNIVNMSWYDNTSSDSSNAHIGSGGRISRVTSSSKRYKHDISPLVSEELAPEHLYDIPVNEYVYNCGYLNPEDSRYDKKVIGFIAEEVYKHYPIAAEKNEYGEVENWNDRYLIPPMLSLIQKQKKQLDEMSFEIQVLKMQLNNLLGGI